MANDPDWESILGQYSQPLPQNPLDEEAAANLKAMTPATPARIRPDEVYRGAFLPFRETTSGKHEWAVPGFFHDVYDAAKAVYDTSGTSMNPMVRPSQLSQDSIDQVLGHGMALAGAGITGGLARSALSLKHAPGTTELGIFGGIGAKTADKAALELAQKMTAEGAKREDVWSKTGWFQGQDGKWRFEIDDSASKYNADAMKPKEYNIGGNSVMGREGVAGSVLEHQALADAYPGVPGIKVTRTAYNDGRLGHYDKGGGKFDMEEHIALNMGSPMFQGRSTMLHELQHRIQNEEQFAPGASPGQFPKEGVPNPAYEVFMKARETDPELRELLKIRESGEYDQALKIINENYARNFEPRIDALDNLPRNRQTYDAEVKPLYDALFAEAEASNRAISPTYARHDDLYKSLGERGIPRKEPSRTLDPEAAYRASAGEAEARAVQSRMDLTPEQRQARPPWLDYDVPESQQIVRFGNDAAQASMSLPPKRAIDPLGFYSHALDAAYGLKQAKGTPEQMLAQLKSAGVKDAEIEAAGLDRILSGKPMVTRDEIVSHLDQNRVGVNVATYMNDLSPEQIKAEKAIRARYDELKAPIEQQIQTMPRRSADMEKLNDLHDARHNLDKQMDAEIRQMLGNPAGVTKWANYSLDPSNSTYRETVLHLPENTTPRYRPVEHPTRPGEWALIDAAGNYQMANSQYHPNTPAFYKTEQFARNSAETDRGFAENVPAMAKNFRSGHFSEPNIIGHMMTSMTRHEGKPVYTIDQIQSDWGQKLRDGGVRDEKKIAELQAKRAEHQSEFERLVTDVVVPFFKEHGAEPPRFPTHAIADLRALARDMSSRAQVGAKALGLRLERAHQPIDLINAEIRTAEASSPGHPLVNTTDQWTNTTLRRAIKQAADSGAEYIAIPSGRTVESYNPQGSSHGVDVFYDKIVPKNLGKILSKYDKDAGTPIRIDTLDSPSGKTGLGKGFTLFRITDKVKKDVSEGGVPLFASGGAVSSVDDVLDQYSAPAPSNPLDDEALANYRAANPAAPTKLRPEETYRGTFLPFRETTSGAHEWAVPGILHDVWDAAQAVRDSTGTNVGPMIRPSQLKQDELDQVLGHGMALAGAGITGGVTRAMLSPKGTNELGIFGGKLARTADQAALAKAEEMATAGAPREQIWKDTGWFQGVDGKWRFEIDDSGMKPVIGYKDWINRKDGVTMAPHIGAAVQKAAENLTPEAPVRVKRIYEHGELDRAYRLD